MDDLEGTRETYDRVAGAYERRHGTGEGARETGSEVIADLLSAFAELAPAGSAVLDAGCGPGWEAAALADRGFEVVGLDLVEAVCRRAGRRVPGRVLQGDMRSLPLAGGALGGVWACASLLHVPRPAVGATLAEFRRVLVPGGACSLSVKAGEGTRTAETYEDDARTVTLFRPAALEAELRRAGFAAVSIDRGDGWLRVLARAADRP